MTKKGGYSSLFLDDDDNVIDLTGATEETVSRHHGYKTRQRYGTKVRCVDCHGECHIVRLNDGALYVVKHNPSGRSCLYNEMYEQVAASDRKKSHAHIEAQVRIAMAVASVPGWDVEIEKQFDDGLKVGERVVVDVAYKNRKTLEEHLDEVQLSYEAHGQLLMRTNQRHDVSPKAITQWLTPHAAALGDIRGLIVDDKCQKLHGRSYTSISPLIAEDPLPSVGEAIKRTIRTRDRWVVTPAERLAELDYEVGHITMPLAAASTLPERTKPKPPRVISIIEDKPCDRPMAAAPPMPPARVAPARPAPSPTVLRAMPCKCPACAADAAQISVELARSVYELDAQIERGSRPNLTPTEAAALSAVRAAVGLLLPPHWTTCRKVAS